MSTATSAPTLNGWRIAGWGALTALLALPAIAMQFTTEVDWTGSDFAFAAALLGTLGLGGEFAVRKGRGAAHKIGLALATIASFLTVWANAAVGIIGDGQPVNLVFFAVPLAFVGAVVAFRNASRPLAYGAALAALAYPLAGVFARTSTGIVTAEWAALVVFAMMWGAAAAAFAVAARQDRQASRA